MKCIVGEMKKWITRTVVVEVYVPRRDVFVEYFWGAITESSTCVHARIRKSAQNIFH
jgi:hypothetical protein